MSDVERQGLRVPRWVWVLVCVDLSLAVANVVTFAVTRGLGLEPVSLFRLSDEANIPSWWSSVQLLFIAMVLAALAMRSDASRGRRSVAAWLPAGLFLLLSIDEVASIHERVGHAFGPQALRTGTWVVFGLPLFLIALVVVTRAVWPMLKGHRAVMMLFAAGAGLLVLSAAGIELLANLFADNTIAVHLCVLAEETGEMLAGTIMLWAAVRWAVERGIGLVGVAAAERQPPRAVPRPAAAAA